VSFLPDAATLLAYTIACIILVITPGPDLSLMLSRTLAFGARHGLVALLGVTIGCAAHTLAAAFGLSQLIAASPTGFGVVKIAGALYLLFLAVEAIRKGSALDLSGARLAPASLAASLWAGLGVNLTNPKVVLFFVTFLPQFVSAGDPDAPQKFVFLGMTFVVWNILICAAFILVADRFITALRTRPGIMRGIDYMFATVFGLFAASIFAVGNR
jgi:threonine/homoserine/homoserine lactone efflux protein